MLGTAHGGRLNCRGRLRRSCPASHGPQDGLEQAARARPTVPSAQDGVAATENQSVGEL